MRQIRIYVSCEADANSIVLSENYQVIINIVLLLEVLEELTPRPQLLHTIFFYLSEQSFSQALVCIIYLLVALF